MEATVKGVPIPILLAFLVIVMDIVGMIVAAFTSIEVLRVVNVVSWVMTSIIMGIVLYEVSKLFAREFGYPLHLSGPTPAEYSAWLLRPAVLLEYSGPAIVALNAGKGPALAVRVEEIRLRKGGSVAENMDSVKCDAVAGLGTKEKAELCLVEDPLKFIEDVELIKISYYDAFGNRHERAFRVKWDGRPIFVPIFQE